ncbi:MAG: inorganic phosphate transporter [Chloroflexota bacterium]|nr:inorganic phosphate transporter [Chloroflexota bacterium]
MPELAFFVLVIVLAVGFAVINGFNDAANAIATVIGTRVLSPTRAVAMAAVLNFAGAATGLAVAKTIGEGIVDPGFLSYQIVLAALLAVIAWGFTATRLGLPISVSHSFVAGLIGAAIGAVGTATIIVWRGFAMVLSAVAVAPALGFAGGLAVMVSLLWILRRTAPLKVEVVFSRLHILASAFMAYSHGKNDGQMPIGIIAIALMLHTGGAFHVPFWAIALSASAIALGTAAGGWRVIRTVGMRITALRPVHGFAATASAAAVVEAASVLGIPVSTTHCVSSAIMGVGATKRLSAVRWGIAGNIVLAWLLTFPVCAGLGWLLSTLIALF